MLYALKNIIRFDTRPKYLQALVVFMVASSIDFIWVCWFRAVTAHAVLIASALSMVMGTMSLFGVTTIIDRRWTLPYWVMGLGTGTALAMLANLH
jgi:hypothetical protein